MFVSYKDCIKTLRETSYDSSNDEYVTECDAKVIDFDKFTDKFFKHYCQKYKVPKSVDSVFIVDDEWYLIEFKNGTTNRADIVNKFAHSLLVLMRNENMCIADTISKVNFILVCDEENKSLKLIRDSITKKANKERIRMCLEQFKNSYFKNVYTLERDEFNNFIEKKNIELPM